MCTMISKKKSSWYSESMAGCSGYPKSSGQVFRVFNISGFQNCSPTLAGKKQNPKFRVPGISDSGLPELPKLPRERRRRLELGRRSLERAADEEAGVQR